MPACFFSAVKIYRWHLGIPMSFAGMHMLSPNAIHPVVVEKARKLTADFSNHSWPNLCGMNQAVTENR
jgi:hypothetical protein